MDSSPTDSGSSSFRRDAAFSAFGAPVGSSSYSPLEEISIGEVSDDYLKQALDDTADFYADSASTPSHLDDYMTPPPAPAMASTSVMPVDPAAMAASIEQFMASVKSVVANTTDGGSGGDDHRQPPFSLEAEQSLLGSILIDPDVIARVMDQVQPIDFYRKAHGEIYEIMRGLYERGEPVDVITVSEALLKQGHLEQVGGRGYVNELSLTVITTENATYYAKLIRNKAILRSLIRLGQEIARTGFESQDAETALDLAQQGLFELSRFGTQSTVAHIGDILPITFEQLEERYANKGSIMGVDTGFYELNFYTSGLQPSDLIILAARPSMGKTAFCLNILTHVALRAQKPVLMFSLEMSKESVIMRMLCAEAEMDQQRIRTGELTEYDFQRLSAAMGRLGDAPIYVDDSAGLSVMDIRAKVRKLMMEQKLNFGLIVIDYLQLMESRSSSGGGSENRQQEVSAISRGLKAIAREFRVPVIALSQLSRGVESRTDKRPMLSDLRESGSIEQDADLVMFIYRDEYYNKDSDRPGCADIIIAKQRNGPVGEFELLFKKNIARFVNPKEVRTRSF